MTRFICFVRRLGQAQAGYVRDRKFLLIIIIVIITYVTMLYHLSAKHTNANAIANMHATTTREQARNSPHCMPIRQRKKNNAICEAFFPFSKPDCGSDVIFLDYPREIRRDAPRKCNSFETFRVALRARIRLRAGMFC